MFQFGLTVFIIFDLKTTGAQHRQKHVIEAQLIFSQRFPFIFAHTSVSSYHFPKIVCLLFSLIWNRMVGLK